MPLSQCVPFRVVRAPQSSVNELITAAMEHGSEVVDREIRADTADVRYMDANGVERRVGAKTRLEDVRRARVLRVTQNERGGGLAGRGVQRPGAASRQGRHKKVPTRARDELDCLAAAVDGSAPEGSAVPPTASTAKDLEAPATEG